MPRVRMTLFTAGLAIALAALAAQSQAQAPGGRGGRGGGGFRGFGGFRGSNFNLVMNPAVQADLKLTEKQKTQLKDAQELLNEARDQLRTEMQKNFQNNRGRNRQGNGQRKGGAPAQPSDFGFGAAPGGGVDQGVGNVGNGGQPGQGNIGGGDQSNAAQGGQRNGRRNRGGAGDPQGGFGGQPGGFGGQPGGFGGFGGPQGGFGGPGGGVPPWAMIQQKEEATLAKVLSPKQQQRVKQIALQREGLFALARPDMQEKLNMDEGQMAEIQAIMGQMRQGQQASRNAQRQLFTSFRRADGSFDRDAMRARMDSPEGRAQMEQQRKDATQLRDQASQAIGRVLRKKQKASYLKMIGAPFDVAKLDPRNQNQGDNANAPGADGNPNAKSTTPANSKATKSSQSKTTTKKKSTTRRKGS